MDEQKLVPKLRFPGFTDPWEQRKLGEIYKRVNERNDGTLGRDKWISVAKMYFQDPEKVQSNNLDTRTYVMKKGDIAFEGHPNNEFKFGRFVLNDIGTGIISELFPIYRPIVKYDLEFWKYAIQLERIMAPIFSKSITSSGNSSNKLDQNHFLNQMISIPTIDEQKKIGLILKTITNLITLHQRKLEHLKLKKKSLLQKLFPREGELYPELRFPGFTDPWEQRKLGEMGSTYSGMSGKTKEDFGHGEAVYIPYLNIFQNTLSNLSMTDKVEIDDTQNKVEYGDILFTTSSETPEEVGLSSVWLGNQENLYLNSFCFGYRLKEIIDLYFLGYALRSPYMRNQMKILAQGISRYNISKNKVMDLQINIPCIKEQKYIGEIFLRIDSLITLHQRKLEHLQLLKKALLQQLFV